MGSDLKVKIGCAELRGFSEVSNSHFEDGDCYEISAKDAGAVIRGISVKAGPAVKELRAQLEAARAEGARLREALEASRDVIHKTTFEGRPNTTCVDLEPESAERFIALRDAALANSTSSEALRDGE